MSILRNLLPPAPHSRFVGSSGYWTAIMMNKVSHSASQLFSSEFGNLSALVLKRLELEWHYHQRQDLGRSDQQLLHYAIEFGRLLNVVYRYRLFSALQEECKWYAAVFGARGSSHDAFALVLESWIMAIQGLLKPPECNELARPIQSIRDDLERLLEQASKTCVRLLSRRPSLHFWKNSSVATFEAHEKSFQRSLQILPRRIV